MSEAPERIWASLSDERFDNVAFHGGWASVPSENRIYEYIRADLFDELEDDLQNQTSLIEQLFALLEIKEQKDDGRYFHPNIIRSSRALDAEKLKTIMAELKRTVTANSKSSGCYRQCLQTSRNTG